MPNCKICGKPIISGVVLHSRCFESQKRPSSGVGVGTILWGMRGIRRNGEIKWHAHPRCVESITEHMYLFANGEGTSHNVVGRNCFLSRQECLENFLKSHDSLEQKIGIDDPLEEALKSNVTELERTDFENYEIYPSYTLMYITKIFFEDKLIPEHRLVWNKIPEDDWRSCDATCSLTLNQLSTQLYAKTGRGIITVLVEEPLRGEIFQIGNYSDMKWRKHGTTKGYA